ncbi:MAG: hypothetical protein WCP26_04340 [Actinomycetes bacterium]
MTTTQSSSSIPTSGTWFSRWGGVYELTTGVDYAGALSLATSWATVGLVESDVEVEVEVFPSGNEWVVDVVALERTSPYSTLGRRQARIDSSGRLVA